MSLRRRTFGLLLAAALVGAERIKEADAAGKLGRRLVP